MSTQDPDSLVASLREENTALNSQLTKKSKKIANLENDFQDLEAYHQTVSEFSESQTEDIKKITTELQSITTLFAAKDFELKRLQADYSKLENMSMVSGFTSKFSKVSGTAGSMQQKNTRGWFGKNKDELNRLVDERD
jgi:chromosome segregation ATPase